jgi:hypothetical protein
MPKNYSPMEEQLEQVRLVGGEKHLGIGGEAGIHSQHSGSGLQSVGIGRFSKQQNGP